MTPRRGRVLGGVDASVIVTALLDEAPDTFEPSVTGQLFSRA